MLLRFDAREVLLDGLMRCGLAGEQEVPALLKHRLAHRLAGMEIVAEVDRVQSFVAGAVPLEPAPHGAALAVLLVVTVLRHDEFRLQRHHPVGATTVADTIAWKCSVLSLPRLRGQKAQACGKAR